MKAAVYRRYGPPDVVTVDDVPKPVPRDDEVLVRVHAATVGVVDSLARRGAPFYARSHFGLRRPRFAVIDYTKADFSRAGQAYDVIFDVAGTSSFARCRAALRPAGVYLTTAPSLAILLQMPWTSRFGTRKAVVALTGLRAPGEKRQDLLYIKELAEASALAPVIDACYPLPRIADAYRHVDAGHKKGNVVVTMTDHLS